MHNKPYTNWEIYHEISILSSYDRTDASRRDVSIRIQGLPETRERELRAALDKTCQVLSWTRD